MPGPATTAGTDRLLHCSPERTLVRTVDPSTGRVELLKLFVQGSLTDAEREVQIGQQLQHLAVVRYRTAEVDATTGRPCIRMELHSGVDLAAMVGEEGPPTAAIACELLAPVAETLAAMHALRTPQLPSGLCHVDVKPGNLLRTTTTTLLLDFEHAQAVGLTRARTGFTGGTVEFAPPEAFAGAPAEPSFDVFALGMTLRWLLTADTQDQKALRGQSPALLALVRECTAPRAAARPAMAVVATRLRELAAQLPTDPAEAVLQAIAAGEHERAEQLLQLGGLAGERHDTLRRLLQDRSGLLQRRPRLLTPPPGLPADPAGLTAALQTTRARLRRWPRHRSLLQHRLRLQHTACLLFAESLPKVAELLRVEAFDDADAWLRAAIVLLDTSSSLPGSHRIPGDDDPRLPGPLQRAPRQVLEQQLTLVAETRAEYTALDRRLADAEAALDLAAAEATIDELAARTGGTTAQVARRRDRLHRLGFYLERIGRAGTNFDRLVELTRAADSGIAPARALIRSCATQARTGAHEPGGGLGLRSLQLTWTNLVEEFPQLHARVEPALTTLAAALATATEEAWETLAAAAQKLQAVPVPVRPLQTMLHRLDAFRVIDALVDQPDRARSHLLDRIESLRLKLDQARATRDRLARGAELALSRGHWTTGLFDMERAIEGIGGGDEAETEARALRERLEEARRRKQEVENAQRRNVDLAARYAAQQDEAQGSFAERQATLQQRRDCLQFLVMHAANERRTAYDQDLRHVETQLATEAADDAQVRFDRATDPDTQLQIARSTLAALAQQTRSAASDGAVPARLTRLLEHWQQLADQAQREIERREQERTAARRRRRRRFAAAVAGLLLLLTTAVAVWQASTRTAQAGSRLEAGLPVQRAVAALRADPQAAVADLARFASELEPAPRAAAEAVVATIRETLMPAARFDVPGWHQRHVAALRAFAATWPPGQRSVLARFGSDCWRTALVLASAPPLSASPDQLQQFAASAAGELTISDIRLPDGHLLRD